MWEGRRLKAAAAAVYRRSATAVNDGDNVAGWNNGGQGGDGGRGRGGRELLVIVIIYDIYYLPTGLIEKQRRDAGAVTSR